VEHLAARGTSVVTVQRPFEPRALLDTLRDVDAVIHSPEWCRRCVNGTMSPRTSMARGWSPTHAGRPGLPLVNISSLAAAGPASPRNPRSEDDPPAPINAYGRSKLEGERAIARLDGLRWTTIRPGVVYGPRDRALIPLFKVAARGLMPMVGRLDAAYSFIHVHDLVRAIAAAVDRPAAGDTVFAAHPLAVSTREILEAVRTASGARAAIIRVPMALTRAAAVVGDLAGTLRGRPSVINSRRYAELASEGFVCRVDRLRDRLGVVAEIGLQEGLADAYAWYRREGWL
jgi:Nucleoside-diphosphate-sugar epimerases